MEEAKKEARLNLVLTKEEMERLKDLAAANTGNNSSLMVRELINLAWGAYDSLGLHPPKADAPSVKQPLMPSMATAKQAMTVGAS
jgi:hypothetical protein